MPFMSIVTLRRVAVVAVVCAATAAHAADAAKLATRAELVMGTVARITIADGATNDAFEAGFAALRRVDAGMSLYRPDSALVRVNAHAAAHAERVDDELFALLARCAELSALTDGAFDVTILPLLRSWGAYPGLDHVAAGRVDAVGWRGLHLDRAAKTVAFGRDGMGIDLGGVAKGFALGRARAALAAAGVRRATVDLGGNLALLGDGPDGAWRIAVLDPESEDGTLGVLALAAGDTVSTSGNYARDFAAEGWSAPSHIYDPRTGKPVRGDLAVTVWTSDATAADALSTAFLVLGPDASAPVLARFPDVGVLFVAGRTPDRRLILAGRAPLGFTPSADARLVTARANHTESR
jgi:thiamine biosynthesis lipoprotein